MQGIANTADMARLVSLTPARISQLKAQGRLDGCFSGEGRGCRYDVAKTLARLGRTLDKGQMLGNGAATKAALAKVTSAATDAPDSAPSPPSRRSEILSPEDPDRYELARTQKAEEEARRLRRQNASDEGHYVLASEVERSVQRLVAQEVAEFEGVMRIAARRVADEMGVDFKAVRAVLISAWREHRGTRATTLDELAAASTLSDAERAEDI